MKREYSGYAIWISALLIICMFAQCKNQKTDKRLQIINNSNNRIYANISTAYPDTSIPAYNPSLDNHFGANPGETITYPIKGPWEGRFKKMDKLEIFIFDDQVLKNNPMDTIRARYMILKRYDLSYDSLQKIGWHVNYP